MNIYDVGDTVVLEVTVTLDGVPADPDAVSLILHFADGTKTTIPTESITHDTTGHYSYSYNVAKTGRIGYTWVGTGSTAFSETGHFYVRKSTSLS